jgi:hypothetical protein
VREMRVMAVGVEPGAAKPVLLLQEATRTSRGATRRSPRGTRCPLTRANRAYPGPRWQGPFQHGLGHLVEQSVDTVDRGPGGFRVSEQRIDRRRRKSVAPALAGHRHAGDRAPATLDRSTSTA